MWGCACNGSRITRTGTAVRLALSAATTSEKQGGGGGVRRHRDSLNVAFPTEIVALLQLELG